MCCVTILRQFYHTHAADDCCEKTFCTHALENWKTATKISSKWRKHLSKKIKHDMELSAEQRTKIRSKALVDSSFDTSDDENPEESMTKSPRISADHGKSVENNHDVILAPNCA